MEELTILSMKYDLWIGGCGCCESPWATALDPKREIPHYEFTTEIEGEINSIHPADGVYFMSGDKPN